MHHGNGALRGTAGSVVTEAPPSESPQAGGGLRVSRRAGRTAGRGRSRSPGRSTGRGGGATGSRGILARLAPVAIMADTLLLVRKRGPIRSAWKRTRKARPQLTLSRRPRRRLWTLLRWCGRRRLRRRLLQAQAAGADWREGGCLVRSAAAAAKKTKTAVLSAAPRHTSGQDSAPSRFPKLPVRLLRPAGPGRALLLLPLEQVSRAGRVRRVEGAGWRRSPGGFRPGEDRVPSAGSPVASRAHFSWRWC